MINLPPITGSLRPVPVSSYHEIIAQYVDKVRKVEQVSSIIQMGSFSKPGISDIDLIITLKDGMPFPDWEDISLKQISAYHKDAEIIAHDIFIIPENIAENAEAYFYIDQQNVLKGKKLGGVLSNEMIEKCKEFLALEYAIFSLDIIANILLVKEIELRRLILLISTMRHSATIACDLKIINGEEKDKLINRIENLRSDVLSGHFSVEEISALLEKFIVLLISTVKQIGIDLTKNISRHNLKTTWKVSLKTGMVAITNEDYLGAFMDVVNKQKESFSSKYTQVFALPIEAQMHVGAYLDGNEKAALYFRKNFNMVQQFHDTNTLNAEARRLRGEVVRLHWKFISNTGYFKSSGRAYCGLSYPNKKTYKTFLQGMLLSYQLRSAKLA